MYAALITWNYSYTDNNGFLLQRSENSGSTWTKNYTITNLDSQYTDYDVVTNGTYWYRIAATNPIGTGNFTNTGSIFIPPICTKFGSEVITFVNYSFTFSSC